MEGHPVLDAFARAAKSGSGEALSKLFTENGVYHDGFYGAFYGRAGVASFLDDHVYRDSQDLEWTFKDIASGGDLIYARYDFSYTSTLPEASGCRVYFTGVAAFRLNPEGLIEQYWELFDTGTALVQLGFSAERIAGFLRKRAARDRAAATPHHRVGQASNAGATL